MRQRRAKPKALLDVATLGQHELLNPLSVDSSNGKSPMLWCPPCYGGHEQAALFVRV